MSIMLHTIKISLIYHKPITEMIREELCVEMLRTPELWGIFFFFFFISYFLAFSYLLYNGEPKILGNKSQTHWNLYFLHPKTNNLKCMWGKHNRLGLPKMFIQKTDFMKELIMTISKSWYYKSWKITMFLFW